ncbi:type II toxin-antitoxin system HicA family toxin [Anaerocolumna aminovalerica]|uniref:type II toxin-antitoxin system HicA family toxin n=1 Tax=Anaerocolumna aminovalerica TaxID=1527 RepID=UPI001C0EAB3D|nr:type II toxin-antitoxin system HicA family toxin [Anaerocolumna aminovalerica]MBU5331426.1 type II toxin-antitoxin system HicA family toxin [Anaerocolumna aminovalerica]
MPMTPKEMIKYLKQNGFYEDRQDGSHKFFINPETKRCTTVPYHSKDLGKGLEHKILKDAGLKKP